MTVDNRTPHPALLGAIRQLLELDLAGYTAGVAATGEAGGASAWAEVALARDHLLRTLELAALVATAAERGGDALTLEALTDAWLRAHRG